MALPRSYSLADGGGYHFDLGDGGPPVFAAGPDADAVAAQLPPPQPPQLDIPPELAAAAQKPEDQRTASAEDVIANALAPKKTAADSGGGQGIVLPEQHIGGSEPPKYNFGPGGPRIETGPVRGPTTAAEAARGNDAIAQALNLPPSTGPNILDIGQSPAALAAVDAEVKRMQGRHDVAHGGGPAPSGAVPSALASLMPHVVGYRKEGVYMPTAKVTEGTAAAPEVVEAYDKAERSKENAAARAGAAGVAQADEEFAARQGYQDEMQRRYLEEQQREQARQQEISDRMQKATQLADDARNQKIDPKQVWADETGPAAVLAMALGGLAQGGLGLSSNPMMDQVNKMVDRQIAAQEKNAANTRASAGEAQNLVQLTRQQHGDERSAYLSTRASMLANLEGMLQTEAAKYKGTQAAINAQNAIASIQEERAGIMNKLAQQVQEKVSYRYLPPGPIVSGGVDKHVLEEAKDLANKEDSDKVIEQQANTDAMNELINRYKGADSIPGFGIVHDIKGKVPFGSRILMNDEERANAGTIERWKLGMAKEIAGARAISMKEARDAVDTALEGAKTPAELARAVADQEKQLNLQRRSLEAGYDPRAVAYRELQGAYVPKTAPSTLRRRGAE